MGFLFGYQYLVLGLCRSIKELTLKSFFACIYPEQYVQSDLCSAREISKSIIVLNTRYFNSIDDGIMVIQINYV
jgi:hypothetical protein